MLKFAKLFFYGVFSLILNIVPYAVFGGLVAFFVLVFSADVPSMPKSTSPALANFLKSKAMSQNFAISDINEGLFYMIFDCAKEQSKETKVAVAAPTPPVVLVREKKLFVCVPFTAKAMSSSLKLGAFVELEFDGKEVEAKNVRIGNAKLPEFIGEDIAETLLEFYSSIKPIKKYFEILEHCKVEIISDAEVRIVK